MLPNVFMAEAKAMLITMKEWSHRTIAGGRVTVYTDCCSLVKAIRGGDILQYPSWRAAELIAELRRTLEET
jgi:hypothetical protein